MHRLAMYWVVMALVLCELLRVIMQCYVGIVPFVNTIAEKRLRQPVGDYYD